MTTGQTEAAVAIDRLQSKMISDFAAGVERIAGLVEVYYAEDARFLPPDHPIVSGRPQIRAFLQGMLSGGQMDLTLENLTRDESGDLAYHAGKYTLTIHPAAGEPIHDEGKYLEVFRRQANGRWQCVADMFSSDTGA